MANRIDNINLTVAQITDLTQPLSLAQGGVGATTPEGGRKTLGFDTMGIGVATNALPSLDWQNFDFVPGANYSVLSGNMTNVPSGLDVPGTTYNVSIRAYGPEGGTRHVDVCFSTTTAANYRYYQVRLAGALGSRTFTVRQIWTSADTVPIANGGTGATTTTTALTNLGAVPTTRTVNGKALSSNVVLANADISGSAASGNNSDITTLNALTNVKSTKVTFEQSPTIPDGAQPYDAVNLRQLQATGSGGGANMNGVMNNHIGAIEWFNGSRAKLPAGYIAADGQVVSRTDAATSDLWAAVNGGMYVSVTDTLWLSGPGSPKPKGQNRGKYSTGGTSNPPSGSGVTGAWFRVPDLNGVQTDSIRAVFLRGDAAGGSSNEIGVVGDVLGSAAPDISGGVGLASSGTFAQAFVSAFGALTASDDIFPGGGGDAIPNGTTTTPDRKNTLRFKASKGDTNGVYGRLSANGTQTATEVRPNSVTGIWIIRASGAFTSANTAFNVINSDATKPSGNPVVKSGESIVKYNIGTQTQMSASLYAEKTLGGNDAYANIKVINTNLDGSSAKEANYQFTTSGQITADTRPTGTGTDGSPGSTAIRVANYWNTVASVSYAPIVGGGAGQAGGSYRTFASFGIMAPANGAGVHANAVIAQTMDWNLTTGVSSETSRLTVFNPENLDIVFMKNDGTLSYTFTKNATSDERLKRNIEAYDAAESLRKIEALEFKSFVYISDEQERVRRGVIAQQAEQVDPLYVKTRQYPNESGEPFEQKELDTNALLLDALAAIKVLSTQVKDLQTEIAELKSK